MAGPRAQINARESKETNMLTFTTERERILKVLEEFKNNESTSMCANYLAAQLGELRYGAFSAVKLTCLWEKISQWSKDKSINTININGVSFQKVLQDILAVLPKNIEDLTPINISTPRFAIPNPTMFAAPIALGDTAAFISLLRDEKLLRVHYDYDTPLTIEPLTTMAKSHPAIAALILQTPELRDRFLPVVDAAQAQTIFSKAALSSPYRITNACLRVTADRLTNIACAHPYIAKLIFQIEELKNKLLLLEYGNAEETGLNLNKIATSHPDIAVFILQNPELKNIMLPLTGNLATLQHYVSEIDKAHPNSATVQLILNHPTYACLLPYRSSASSSASAIFHNPLADAPPTATRELPRRPPSLS